MSGACLDPETLALWMDDGLSAADRAAAERHVADCARCQAALAALVRTTPVEERRPWWRLSRAVWLAPVTAAAAALVIWFAVPAAPPPQPSIPASAPAASPPQAARDETANKPAPPARPARERRDEKRLADKSPAPEIVAAAPPPPPPPARVANPALAPQPQAFAGVAADAVSRSARQANAIAADIVSPDPMSRWRISAGSTVEHSTDGGATWQQQATGTTSALTGGSAPSPSICWVVGQDGVVLLSTDGRTWRRMNFPTTAALVSVRATDDRMATVTDANGRTYVTSDGGTTWMQG